ncbi:MAG TPA: hypothetical protein VGE52_08175, partial [Pirellulales bacterium]
MARKKKSDEKPATCLELQIARASMRLSVLSQIINDIDDGSLAPSDAFYRGYRAEMEFERCYTSDESVTHFTCEDLGDIIMPSLLKARQDYL